MTERKKVPNVPPKKTVYFVLCKVFIKMEEKTNDAGRRLSDFMLIRGHACTVVGGTPAWSCKEAEQEYERKSP